jgi:hypothetical protein
MNCGSEPGRKPPSLDATSHMLAWSQIWGAQALRESTHSVIMSCARTRSRSDRWKLKVGCGIPYPSSYSVSKVMVFVSTGSEYPKKRRSTIVRVSIVAATAP